MLKKMIFIGIIAFAMPVTTFSAVTKCECGTHSTGITAYSVEGENCCTDDVTGIGNEYTYYQQFPGVWVLDTHTTIPAQDAQDDCCPSF